VSEFRPDFFDLHLALPTELLLSLSAVPHLLQDQFGNTISSFATEQLSAAAEALQLEGKPIATLRLSDASSKGIATLLQSAMALEFRALRARNESEAQTLLTRDLSSLLRLSEQDDLKFEDLLSHFLKILRAHVWVERTSIYGIYDGFTLEGLAGVGGDSEKGEWKLNFSSIAGHTASSRKPYHSENPKADANFQKKDGSEAPRNLLCFPLLHGNTLVGVINLSNRVGGAFSETDKQKVERFSNLLSHILQKHYFKKRMQSFERTSDHLGKYLSSKVVKNVKTKDQLELGGIEKKVVCLFSDIRGYTSITEGISAPSLVNLLNFHFERMHSIIEKYEGTLDKIVGDLIMAVWNIPNDQPDPELQAMKAAIEMQKEMLRVVVPEWKKLGVEKVGMGIGVNAGSAVVGNLGSKHFMNYTVIGDTINTAQRLEAKAGAGEIWMAEHLFPFVSGKLEKPIRKECQIRLKGKEDSIDAYVFRPLSY
jgi:class 3 adenylate cyclase